VGEVEVPRGFPLGTNGSMSQKKKEEKKEEKKK